MRKVPAGLAIALVVIGGCARNDQLSSPLVSTPLTAPTTSAPPTTSTTTTTIPATTTPATAPAAPVTTPAPATSPAPPAVTTAPPAPATTAPPPTTLDAAGCAALPALPADAAETASMLIDVDGDGTDDTVRTYSVGAAPAAGDWHVRAELASGNGSDIALPDDPAPGAVVVLGGAYVGSDVDPGPGGMRPAVFVTTGSGASDSVVTLFRLDGCTLAAMGGGATFPVGGTVTHTESLRCDGTAGTMVLAYTQASQNADGVTFDVTETGYTRDGNNLVVFGAGPITSNEREMPTFPNLIDCPGIDQP